MGSGNAYWKHSRNGGNYLAVILSDFLEFFTTNEKEGNDDEI